MRRLHSFVIMAVLVACSCSAAKPVGPASAADALTASDGEVDDRPLEERFERYVCGDAPACEARDISDPSLDYGEWLAERLGVQPLSRLPVTRSFYVEAGPGEDGASLSLGAVSFVSTDPGQTETIVARLAQIPEGAFSDGKVIMRFRPRIDGEILELVFTDSFHPRMDRFLGTL